MKLFNQLTGKLEKTMFVVAIGAGSSVFLRANARFYLDGYPDVRTNTKMGYCLFSLGTFALSTTAALTQFLNYLSVKSK